jgi:hypothetical protein
VPDVIRFEVDFTVGTDAAALVRLFWAYSGGIPTPGDMLTFAGQLSSALAGPGVALFHTDTQVTEIRTVDLSTATGNTGTDSSVLVGTRAGEALGADVCALMNFTLGRRYRGGKPRMYLPYGVAGDLQTRQTWTSGALGEWTAGYLDTFGTLGGFASGAVTLGGQVNVSYYGPPNRIITGSTGRVRTVSTVRAAPLVDPIVTYAANTHLGSQRRRNLIRT